MKFDTHYFSDNFGMKHPYQILQEICNSFRLGEYLTTLTTSNFNVNKNYNI
jgi:hypothetical protein